ncbi:hypothetical protein E8E11_005999 [Didymella keratinophila]|nr:hypothetical protein E8E11_005999 [Didymella keratinophila]
MKVGEYQKAIITNSVTYSRFMSQNGPPKGAGSTVYAAAAEAQVAPVLAAIELPGESDNKVEIYDTCDEIRRKISAHLKKPSVT